MVNNKHRFVLPVMDDCPLFALLTRLLELEVFLENGGKAVALQEGSLLHQRGKVFANVGNIEYDGDIIAGFGVSSQVFAIFSTDQLF